MIQPACTQKRGSETWRGRETDVVIRRLKTASRAARTGTTAATTAQATREMTEMVMASGPAVIVARAAGPVRKVV